MVIKVIENTYDSFKDKLKNPFYGTLFAVWIIRNREFLFNLFFNEKIDSNERLELLRNQFLNSDAVLNFLGTILISLGLMVLIYLSLNLSRFIVELSERIAKPRIQKLFSTSSIVSREDFQNMEKDRDYFQKKYSEEKIEKNKLQRELDEAKNIANLTIDGGIIDESEKLDDSLNLGQTDLMFVKWKEEGIYYSFKGFIAKVNDKTPTSSFENDFKEIIDELLSMNIIIKDTSSTLFYYTFTHYGKKVKEYYLENFYHQ